MISYKITSRILMASLLLIMGSIAFGDEMLIHPESPTANLLCISECGTCPVICSPPPSPESGKSPPLSTTPTPPTDSPPLIITPMPPTPPLLTPSTPLLLPPEAPIFDFSPPPSYQLRPPPSPPRTPKAPKTIAKSPPDLPYVIVPGGPAPPLGQGQGNSNTYPYYYFYSNGASLSNANVVVVGSCLVFFIVRFGCL